MFVMAKYLWKVDVVKNAGQLVKGMTVEIIMENTSAKPQAKHIIEAIKSKYGVTVSSCHCTTSNFNFQKLS